MQDAEPAFATGGAEQMARLYLLRLWREAAGAPWRAALIPAGGAAPRGFADLGRLAAYLLELAEEGGPLPLAEDAQGAERGDRRAP